SVSLGTLDVPGEGLTLAAWVNADWYPSSANDPRIISKSTNVNENDDLWMLSTVNSSGQIRLRFRLKTQGGTTSTLIGESGDLPTGQWSHVAATFDGSNMRLYLNGVLNGTLAKSGTVAQNPAVLLVIGNQADKLNRRWAGRIDEVRIYNRA